MVHLCVSISDDGLRLESVQKGSAKIVQGRGKKTIQMATLRRQSKSRAASSRQDRGSCSSTASCPVFSGPYSDQEEDPPLRRQSSPLLKGSLSTLHNSNSPNPKGSLSSLKGSVPCLQGSLPGLQISLPNLRTSVSQLKRRSLGSLDNSSPSPSEWSTSTSVQSGSSSDDDGSWDTNSWSSGATCLLRSPVKQDSTETPGEKRGKSCTTDQPPATTTPEPEIIYQNLIFSQPPAKAESKRDSPSERVSTVLRKDAGTQSVSSSCTAPVSSQQRDEKTEDRRKFSQFLNEVTCRVLKSNGVPPQQPSTLRHRYPTPPPPPPSTPSHTPPKTTPHSTPKHPPASAPLSASATNLWSLTSSSLQTIEECDSKDITSSIHQWSKTLPSCKILEPRDVLRKVKGESHFHQEHNLLCTKVQTQPSTGRLYLETDIDRVRRLDEMVTNGTLGTEMNDKGLEKGIEEGNERENRIPWLRNGGLGMDVYKERDKRRENTWEIDREDDKGKEKDKRREMPSWEKDGQMERGREKVKKMALPPQSPLSERSNLCPVFSWPEGYARMSFRSTSLPRPLTITVSEPDNMFQFLRMYAYNYDSGLA